MYTNVYSSNLSALGKCDLREQCKQFGMNEQNLAKSAALIGHSFGRTSYELYYELRREIRELSLYLSELNKEEMIEHSQLCQKLDDIRKMHCNTQSEYKSIYRDEIIDNGFHVNDENHMITIRWDMNNMNTTMTEIQLITCIKRMFTTLNETPIDLYIQGLKKYIILNYRVHDYHSFVEKFKFIFGRIPRKYCFHRKVSVSVLTFVDTYDSVNDNCEILVEIQNINTFVSVDMMREWFSQLLSKCNSKLRRERRKPNICELIEFVHGSFHFIQTCIHDSKSNKSFATVWFKRCKLQMHQLESMSQTNINGALVTFEFGAKLIPPFDIDPNLKFINYTKSIVWDLLTKQNKMHLHYQQSEKPYRERSQSSPQPRPYGTIQESPNCTQPFDTNEYGRNSKLNIINDYYFANVLVERHERIGNLNGKEQKCEENCDELDLVIRKLCRYCMMAPFNEFHILQCICMPEFVRQEYIEQHPTVLKK